MITHFISYVCIAIVFTQNNTICFTQKLLKKNMDEITKELRVLVSLLSMRFPIAELNTTTGYSKGTISNYLSGNKLPVRSS